MKTVQINVCDINVLIAERIRILEIIEQRFGPYCDLAGQHRNAINLLLQAKEALDKLSGQHTQTLILAE